MATNSPTVTVRMLDHLHIYSGDPAATVDFYVQHFGAEESGPFGEGDDTERLFHLAGQLFTVCGFPEGVTPRQPPPYAHETYTHGFGVAHIGLWVEDIDAAVAGLRAAGIEILAGPTTEGDARSACVAAPDGIVLELAQRGL